MNAKDLTEFHSLVDQFQSEMSLKDISSQEGVDCRIYISWRKRNGLSRSRKAMVPATMVDVEVTDLRAAHTSARRANVRIEFEKRVVLDRKKMEILLEFLDKIKQVLYLS